MKIKNLTPYFLIVVLLNVSCRKESLKGESSILIGKWQETAYIYRNSSFGNCSVDINTLNLSISPVIEFKKNGKVILDNCGTETKYSMSFENIDEEFNQRKVYRKLGCLDSIVDSIENHFEILPNLYSRSDKKTYSPEIYVNEKKMIIKSSKDKIISTPNGDSRFIYYHIFEKLN